MAKKKEPDKLSQDSTAAIAANMSYGKYKAIKDESEGTKWVKQEFTE